MRDPLTGLTGREDLLRDLALLLNRGNSVALAVIDVDRCIYLNHDLGHQVGDQILITLAELLREHAPGDLYRISGDEFALVMPEATLEQAFLTAERLRAQVQGAQEQFGLPEGPTVTVSIGVAQAPRDTRDVARLLRIADAAQYAAKRRGRNQVALPPKDKVVVKTCYTHTRRSGA